MEESPNYDNIDPTPIPLENLHVSYNEHYAGNIEHLETSYDEPHYCQLHSIPYQHQTTSDNQQDYEKTATGPSYEDFGLQHCEGTSNIPYADF